VSSRRSRHSRVLALAGGLVVLSAAVGLSAALGDREVPAAPTTVPEARAAVFPDSISFDVQYAGIGAEGVDLVWRGRILDEVPGLVTLRMEYAGPAADRTMPIWPVNAWLFFSADDYRSSFAAELSGSMNWRTGEMRLTGMVSDGAQVGTSIEQHVRLQRPGSNGSATVRFIPRLYSIQHSRARGHSLGSN
jgi:hypothetical protein